MKAKKAKVKAQKRQHKVALNRRQYWTWVARFAMWLQRSPEKVHQMFVAEADRQHARLETVMALFIEETKHLTPLTMAQVAAEGSNGRLKEDDLVSVAQILRRKVRGACRSTERKRRD